MKLPPEFPFLDDPDEALDDAAFYAFTAPLWIWQGKGAWHFITVPEEVSVLIRTASALKTRGFRSVKVRVNIGTSAFETSIFPDSKTSTYLLPIKASVRKAEAITPGDAVGVALTLV